MGINVGDVKHYFRSQREKQGVDIEEDESTFCDQNIKNIPKTITTPDGTNVSIEFGVSSDGVSSDQKVAPGIISALERALHHANNGYSNKITKIFISTTSNGNHSTKSNHYKNKAIDISRINGQNIINMTDFPVGNHNDHIHISTNDCN